MALVNAFACLTFCSDIKELWFRAPETAEQQSKGRKASAKQGRAMVRHLPATYPRSQALRGDITMTLNIDSSCLNAFVLERLTPKHADVVGANGTGTRLFNEDSMKACLGTKALLDSKRYSP